jgi:hypothetical protein
MLEQIVVNGLSKYFSITTGTRYSNFTTRSVEFSNIYKNHFRTRCTTQTRPNCHHRHEIKCDTEYKEKCRNYVEQSCVDNWRTVCETKSNIVCEVQQKEIEVPYEEDECTTRQERRCEKHWEETSEGRKVWVDNPATCKLFDTTDCHPVTKYRTGYLVDDVCHDVPVETCKQVKDTKCHDVPQTKCTKEPY